jgi:hypothetical protein
MKKTNNIAILATMVIGFLSLLTSGTNAQKTVSVKTDQPTCTGKPFVMPASISVNNEAFADFIKVASMPMTERRESFSKQSNEQKANYIKTNLALQFIKRPNMTSDQKAFVLDAVSKVSADTYDKSDPEKVSQSRQTGEEMENRALGLFAYKDLGDFIEPMQTEKTTEVALLQGYEDLLKNGMIARRRIAKDMPVNDRVNIWKVQLAYHLVTGKFSKVQNEFILDFLVTLSPTTFEHPRFITKEEELKALEILDKKIQNVFSRSEQFAIFEEIGIQKIVTDVNEKLQQQPNCNCRWHCSSGGCASVPNCNDKVLGCGPVGDWSCYNMCVY